MNENNKIFRKLFILISILIPIVVAVLIYLPKSSDEISPWIYNLPLLNAIINTFTAILRGRGYYVGKNSMVKYHKISMISAFILGALFLVFYIIYHSNAPSTKFGGEGLIRIVYLFFLMTHILLAFIVVPLVLSAIYFAVSDKIDSHRRIVKFTFPVWLYVSITGVIVYMMINPYYPN